MISEEEGAKLVKDLQAVAGISETDESALAAWKSYKDHDKESTIRAHGLIFGRERDFLFGHSSR